MSRAIQKAFDDNTDDLSYSADHPSVPQAECRDSLKTPSRSESDEPQHSCDLCSEMISECQPYCTDSNAELCAQCFKQFQALPEGKVRECLERFLLGNVV